MRSMAQLISEVKAIATINTRNNASAIEEMPIHAVRIRKAISAMNAEVMNTSPWAKFTMPTMP
jgi:hypothetical protein